MQNKKDKWIAIGIACVAIVGLTAFVAFARHNYAERNNQKQDGIIYTMDSSLIVSEETTAESTSKKVDTTGNSSDITDVEETSKVQTTNITTTKQNIGNQIIAMLQSGIVDSIKGYLAMVDAGASCGDKVGCAGGGTTKPTPTTPTPKPTTKPSTTKSTPKPTTKPSTTAPKPSTTPKPTTAPKPVTTPTPTTAPKPVTTPKPTTAPKPVTTPKPTVCNSCSCDPDLCYYPDYNTITISSSTGGAISYSGTKSYTDTTAYLYYDKLSNTPATGYKFSHYEYSTSSSFSSATTFTSGQYSRYGNIYVRGVFTPINYSITYNTNGGSGTAPASQTKAYNAAINLQSYSGTKTGYTFKGWSTSSTATSATYTVGQTLPANGITSNLALYAVWSPNTYTISYMVSNGSASAPANQSKRYDQALTLATYNGTRTNYKFIGWSTSSVATTAEYANGATLPANGIASNLTLYGVWELQKAPFTVNVYEEQIDGTYAYKETKTYEGIIGQDVATVDFKPKRKGLTYSRFSKRP